MNCTVDRKLFLGALSAAALAVEKRTTIPILRLVKLSVFNQHLTVTGTDLEHCIQKVIPCSASDDFPEVVVNPTMIDKFIRPSKHEHVLLTVVDRTETSIGKLQVVTAGQITLDIMSAESFPDMPEFGSEESPITSLVNIEAATFVEMMNQVNYATSQEESRFTLNGFLMEIDSTLRMVATDGHRMAFLERGQFPGDHKYRVLFRRGTADLATKLWSKSKAAMAVIYSKHADAERGHIIMVAEDMVLIAQELTGNFPDYRRVLPNYEVEPARMKGADLLAAIDGVKPCADERSRDVRLEFNCQAVKISAETTERGRAEFDALCATGSAHNVSVRLCYQYIADAVKSFGKGADVEIYCDAAPVPEVGANGEPVDAESIRVSNAKKSAWEFRSQSDPGLRAVIMPMRDK